MTYLGDIHTSYQGHEYLLTAQLVGYELALLCSSDPYWFKQVANNPDILKQEIFEFKTPERFYVIDYFLVRKIQPTNVSASLARFFVTFRVANGLDIIERFYDSESIENEKTK